ncbi:MAG TPA: hypothetical protein VFV57_06305 [Limnobacter sp.]|nr:hypothetical protein [Limnobacter sp.]
MFDKRRSERGVGLMEAILVSCLVAFAVLSAVRMKVQTSSQAASADSRLQVTKAVKEYANLITQAGSDLDLARTASFETWSQGLLTYCSAMVDASGRAQKSMDPQAAGQTSAGHNMLEIWQTNFNNSVRFMSFELTGCARQPTSNPGANMVSLAISYRWKEPELGGAPADGAGAGGGCAVGFRCEKFYVSLTKGV